MKTALTDGKIQTALALIIVRLLVGMIPELVSYLDVVQDITTIGLVGIGAHAIQSGLSPKKPKVTIRPKAAAKKTK
jgi:hypothetical protein